MTYPKQKDDLFELIHSLDKGEKRYFKLNAQIQEGEKNYLKLFEVYERFSNYDKKEIQKLFQKTPTANSSVAKKYLSAAILKSLRAYYSQKSVDIQLNELLINIRLLYTKELYRQCSKTINYAYAIAEKHENLNYQLELINWQTKINDKFEKSLEKSTANIDNLFTKKKNVVQKILNMDEMMLLNIKATTSQHHWGVISRGAKEQVTALKLLEARASSLPPALTIKSRIIRFRIVTVLAFIKGDFKKALEASKQSLLLSEKNPPIIYDQPFEYIGFLFNTLTCLYALGNYNSLYFNTLKKLKAFSGNFPSNSPYKKRVDSSIIWRVLNFELNTYYIQENYTKIHELEIEIEKNLNKKNTLTENHLKPQIFIYVIVFYFVLNNYHKCIYWLNKIQQEPGYIKRNDLQSMVRILALITYYEIGHREYLSYLSQSAYHSLRTKKLLFKFEKAFLNFAKNKLATFEDNKEDKLAFLKIRSELLVFFKDRKETEFLKLFDIISWLDSKISGKTFAEVLSEKAKTKKT